MTMALLALRRRSSAPADRRASQVPKTSPYYRGAVLFSDHCSGCHTLSVVGAEGSATSIANRLRTNGPNFNIRKENVEQVLYAIRNGGFSGAIMPENIVVGDDAKDVAKFLAAVLRAEGRRKCPPCTSRSPRNRRRRASGGRRAGPEAHPRGPRRRSRRACAARRATWPASSIAVIELDARRRALLPELEGLRAEQNEANARIRAAADAGEREREIEAMRAVAARVKELERELARSSAELQAALGAAAEPARPDRRAGARGRAGSRGRRRSSRSAFEPRDHLELAGEMIDMDRAAQLSGARFAYLQGDLVMLELALVRWALEKLRGHGFEPVIPPVLVRERALYGTGFLPDTEQQIYALPEDELFLIGTSEVALASLHDDEILEAERLPLRYAGFSPCFRREAGAAGKDTRGHLPRAPVRQGRDVQLRRAARTPAPSTSGSSRSRRRSSASWGCPTASSTSPSPTSATRRRRSTTARRGCPARAATAS